MPEIKTQTNAWVIGSLFKPVGRPEDCLSNQVTPSTMTRRLRKWGIGFIDDWKHPQIQTELVKHMARQCTGDLLAVLTAMRKHFQTDGGQFEAGLFQAIGQDHTAAERRWYGNVQKSLIERMTTFYFTDNSYVVGAGMLGEHTHRNGPPQLPPKAWREIMMGALDARPGELPATVPHWCALMQAMRLENTPMAWAELQRLVVRFPQLVNAAPARSAHLPLLIRGSGDDCIDQTSLDFFVTHGGKLDEQVVTRFKAPGTPDTLRELEVKTWNKAFSVAAPHKAPVWMLLAWKGNQAALTWGQTQRPEETLRWNHFHDALCLGLIDQWSENFTSEMTTALMQTRAWREPASVKLATAEHVGDVHPFWAALRHAPKLLSRSTADDTFTAPEIIAAMQQRDDLRKATDDSGANVWWAAIGAMAGIQHVRLTTLCAMDLICLPDRHGNGVLMRHPNLAILIENSQPMDTSTATFPEGPYRGLTSNPLWVTLQKNPDGFFGSTPEGRTRTADAIWANLDSLAWLIGSEPSARAAQTLMAFHEIEPATLHPKLRLFVAAVMTVALGVKTVTSEDLAPWASDPSSVGLSPDHPVLVDLKKRSPAFRAALLSARGLLHAPEYNAARRRVRP